MDGVNQVALVLVREAKYGHNITSVVFMGPTVNLRIKMLDVEFLLIHTTSIVKVIEHNLLVE